MVVKNRVLYICKYIRDNTDEEHSSTKADILAYLQTLGVTTARKTVAADVEELQQGGFDIVRNRSRQNDFFIGSRYLEVHELKMLIDAVQAAKFIFIQILWSRSKHCHSWQVPPCTALIFAAGIVELFIRQRIYTNLIYHATELS